MVEQRNIAHGNRLMRDGDYEGAVQCFATIDTSVKELIKICAENIVLARRYGSAQQRQMRVRIFAFAVAENSKKYEREILTEYSSSAVELDVKVIDASDFFSQGGLSTIGDVFFRDALFYVASNRSDVMHIVDFSTESIIISLLYKLIWGAKVIVGPWDAHLDVNSYICGKNGFKPLSVKEVVGKFDGVVFANPALSLVWGGFQIGSALPGATVHLLDYINGLESSGRLTELLARFGDISPRIVRALAETANNVFATAANGADMHQQYRAIETNSILAEMQLENQAIQDAHFLRQKLLQVQKEHDILATQLDFLEIQTIKLEKEYGRAIHLLGTVQAGVAADEDKEVQKSRQRFLHAEYMCEMQPAGAADIRTIAVLWAMLPGAGDKEFYAEMPPMTASIMPAENCVNNLVTRMRQLFDPDYYALQAQLITGEDSFKHFCVFGWKNGLDPNCLFSLSRYLDLNQDVKTSNINPLLHYVIASHLGMRQVGGLLDARFYSQFLTESVPAGISALEHFVYDGIGKGLAPNRGIDPSAYLTSAELQLQPWTRTKLLLERIAQHATKITSPPILSSPNPELSIIVYASNDADATINMLASFAENPPRVPFEIIVAVDGPDDMLMAIAFNWNGVQCISAGADIGWAKSINRAVARARGEICIVLDSRSELIAGWDSELFTTLKQNSKIDIVGGKVLEIRGTLLHGGGLLWQDASLTIRHCGGAAMHPSVNYFRKVDSVSPALFAFRTRRFLRAGGLLARYQSEDYAVADLCCALRELGGDVAYQPMAQMIAFEAHTGVLTSPSERMLLTDRWPEYLAKQPPAGEGSQRGVVRHVMVVDQVTPTPDRDAGSVTQAYILQILVEMGWAVSFVPEATMEYKPGYTEALQRIGVQCIYSPYYQNLYEFVRDEGRTIDLAMLYKGPPTVHYLNVITPHCPHMKVLFDTVDVHYLREMREAELAASPEKMVQALYTKALEIEAMRRSDCTIVLSYHEKELLQELVPEVKLAVLPLILECPGLQVPYHELRDICFIGGFLHQPNKDAVLYFAKDIWPLIKSQLPHVRFRIMGSHAPPEINALASDSIVIDGFVSDLETSLARCRISVAPLRYGAGIKGKVGSSLSFGIPCVATSLAAEGMGLGPRDGVEVADEPSEFAERVIRLYKDDVYWQTMSTAGIYFVEREYSIEASTLKINEIMKILDFPLMLNDRANF